MVIFIRRLFGGKRPISAGVINHVFTGVGAVVEIAGYKTSISGEEDYSVFSFFVVLYEAAVA